jgi:hypothetical protein
MAYAGTVMLGEIVISYECENCGTQDSYSQVLAGDYTDQKSNYIGPRIAAENRESLIETLQKRKINIFQSYDEIKVRKCPHCQHHQSWMHNSLLNRKIDLWTGVLAAASCVFLLISEVWQKFSWSTLFDGLIGYGFIGLLVWFIVNLIIKRIFRSKKKTASEMNLKRPPVLIWKTA